MTDHFIPSQSSDHLDQVSDIAAAYFSNPSNRVGAEEIGKVIAEISTALKGVQTPAPQEATKPDVEKPSAAAIRKSVTDDGIRSFVDGKSYKTLKRHLSGAGHTPESYREAYGLPRDYPMVAPSYAAHRSALAKSIGLGSKGRGARSDSAKAKKAPAAAK